MKISRSVDTHNGGNVWGETKTGEARTIGLPEAVRDALERHRKIQAAEKLAARKWDDPRFIIDGPCS